MPQTITIDGRGDTIQDAIREMWKRITPLAKEGYHPISTVEIVDAKNREIIETFVLTDPELEARLESEDESSYSDQNGEQRPKNESTGIEPSREDGKKKQQQEARAHMPERKQHFSYVARVTLEL